MRSEPSATGSSHHACGARSRQRRGAPSVHSALEARAPAPRQRADRRRAGNERGELRARPSADHRRCGTTRRRGHAAMRRADAEGAPRARPRHEPCAARPGTGMNMHLRSADLLAHVPLRRRLARRAATHGATRCRSAFRCRDTSCERIGRGVGCRIRFYSGCYASAVPQAPCPAVTLSGDTPAGPTTHRSTTDEPEDRRQVAQPELARSRRRRRRAPAPPRPGNPGPRAAPGGRSGSRSSARDLADRAATVAFRGERGEAALAVGDALPDGQPR